MPSLNSLLSLVSAAAFAALAGYGAGYVRASNACATAAEITRLQGDLATARTNLTQAQRAQADTESRLAVMQAENLDLQESINDLTDDVAARQGRDACRLTDDDARRLLTIR